MEVYSKKGSLVWRILGKINWPNKASIKKTFGRAHITLLTLQTIVTEVEAVLNDRPLTHISDDITDPQPLTPAHVLHSRRITKLPHQPATVEELQDPDYSNAESVRRDAKIQSILLQHFVSRWKHEYLTSLRVLPPFWNKWSTNQCWRCCVGPRQLFANQLEDGSCGRPCERW